MLFLFSSFFFFFNDTATTEIYTLSLHDALPIYSNGWRARAFNPRPHFIQQIGQIRHLGFKRAILHDRLDRKSTRLNSSHVEISYAVFCLKKKKNKNRTYNSTIHITQLHTHPYCL